jgi:GlpG protein
MGPLTLALVLVCVGITLAGDKSRELLDQLYMTHFWIDGAYLKWVPGLPEIRAGQVWRLITPIFIHAGAAHLIFNSLAMLDLGSMVEARRGSLRLLLLVLVLAVASNLGQYYLELPNFREWPLHFRHGAPNFCGISGVAFGLMGYVWMKSRFDPESGFFLHRQAVIMMMAWFVICLLGVIPGVNFANTAHSVGLLVGVIWGYASSWISKRPRPA